MHRTYPVRVLVVLLVFALVCPLALAGGERNELYALMSEMRVKYGVSPLILDAELSALAQLKAEDMRDNNYCGHDSPRLGNVRQLLKDNNVSFKGAGENVARSRSVRHSNAAFLSSWGHRINELSPSYTHVGIGVAVTSAGFVYVCEIFVRR